jgi:hypothetical protein
LQDAGVFDVGLARFGRAFQSDREVPTARAIKQCAEQGFRIEARHAQPAHCAVAGDERSRGAIADQTVVFNGQIAVQPAKRPKRR